MFNFKAVYNRDNFLSFLSKDFLPEDFNAKEENLSLDFTSKYATAAVRLGKCPSLDLEVFEITHKSTHDARVGISRDAFQLLLRKSYCNRALVAFVPEGSKNYRFSLLQIEAEQKEQSSRITHNYSNPRRYSYFLGEDAHTKTPEQFLFPKDNEKKPKIKSIDDLTKAFSVEVLTKQFYNELSNWYFWAIKNVSFPNDINDDSDDEKYNTENVIRLITRLIFTWFLKQKKLINPDLFDPDTLSDILKNFKPESEKQTNYYRAVLQNLFFATLNQEIGKRGFAEDKGFLENRGTNEIKNLYRFEKDFSGDTKQIMQLFSQVPFLNGGLFECLDDKKKDGKTFYWDGFSRNLKRQANIPNSLFFAKEQIVDISKEYNNKKMQAVKVSGIIEILNRYNFTVEENTPVEIEVALDPELLGKVFENLLGAFNPETQETARKQTGSFYTPREIVSYMVNESLIAYFKTNVPELSEETIRALFSYEEQVVEIAEPEREAMIQAAFNCKILDPACGSGAFPMGILQQMVHILRKLDPDNTSWNNVVMTQAMKDFEKTDKLNEEDIDARREEIERTFDDGLNYPDYARKLHVIENCIYGVDIQSIAVQISKLRFFISLVCEQRKGTDATDNYGIRPLPNLETKFVAANTLIGLEKTEEDLELFNDDHIKTLIDTLQHLRHRQFSVTNATEKKRLRKKDEDLRHDIEQEVATLYKRHKDENRAFYERQRTLAEKELQLIDKTLERSAVSTNIFGETITKTYKPNEKRKKELLDTIKISSKKVEEASDYSRLGAIVTFARQLTSWNPYDQNESSPFFDSEWMFGLSKENGHLNEATGYFDIVIGNPPYVSAISLPKEIRTKLNSSKDYSTLFQKWDIYVAFIEKGIKLTKKGITSMIVPFPITNQTYAKKLRDYILNDNNLIEITNLSGNKIFEEATVTNCILFVRNNKHDNYKIRISKLINNAISATDTLLKSHLVKDKKTSVWDLSNKKSIRFDGDKYFKLSDFCFISVGMVLNADERKAKGLFIKDDLLSEVETQTNIKRYTEAKNIQKYGIEKTLFLEWNTDRVPDLIRRPTFPQLYERPKIMVSKIGKIKATFDETNIFCDQTIRILVMWNDLKNVNNKSIDKSINRIDKINRQNLEEASKQVNPKFLLALINSKLVGYILDQIRGVGNIDINPEYLKNIPIPKTSLKRQKDLIDLVNQILASKKVNLQFDTSILEYQIDNLVYKIYELTYDEVKLIDSEFKLREKEYNDLQLN